MTGSWDQIGFMLPFARTLFALALLLACGPPEEDHSPTPDTVEAPSVAGARPEETPETTEEQEQAPAGDSMIEVPERSLAFGRPTRFDDRTGARVRSAIRRRIGARPELVTTRHYRRDDSSTTSIATFTASHVERCVTNGGTRESCTTAAGEGSLASDVDSCVFGGIARIDIGPPDGEREGAMRIVGVRAIGDDVICGFEVESLQLVDEDRDDEPEVVLSYGWYDLRHRGGERLRGEEGSTRLTLQADLTEQVSLTVRAYHHMHSAGPDARNVLTQLRHVRRGSHPDLVLHNIDWLSAQCAETSPPRGRGDVCDLREYTRIYRYDRSADIWVPPES